MAMSGGTSYLVRSKYADYGNKDWTTDLYVYVKLISQDKINNKSKISLGMYVYSKYEIDWTDHGSNGTSYVGTATSGANCFTFTRGRSGSGTYWLTENHEVTVMHKSDGTLTLPIYWHWGVNSAWGQYQGPSGSVSVTLPTIDRTAPTVSVSVSNVTVNSIRIYATSDENCDVWEYSLDGGSTWVQYSTIDGTSTVKTISGLIPNTEYAVRVRARKKTNYVKGSSAVRSVKTLGGSTINSVNTLTADEKNPIIQMNWTVYNESYTHKLVIKNGSDTILIIGGLTASRGTINKTYSLSSEQRTTLLEAMVNLTSFRATFELITYDGDTQIGDPSIAVATIQTTSVNSKPVFYGFNFKDVCDATRALTENDQLLIQGQSDLRIMCGSTIGTNYATIEKIRVIVGSKIVESTTSPIDFGKVSLSGEVTITVSVIDSRGHTTTRTKTVTVIPFEKIRLGYWFIRRINDTEEMSNLIISGDYSPVTMNDVERNYPDSFKYRYRKKVKDEPWGDWLSVKLESSNGKFEYTSVNFGRFDPDYPYEIQLIVSDQLTESEIYLNLPKGTPLVAYREKRVGINNAHPQSALDVLGDIRQNGEGVLGFVGVLEDDFDTMFTGGIYWYAASLILDNAPSTNDGFLLVVTYGIKIIHIFVDIMTSGLLVRSYYADVEQWSPWSEK